MTTDHEDLRRRLSHLSRALLDLHKTLMDGERIEFEKTSHQSPSANQFLQLLLSDPRFAWLRQLSSLVAAIDDAVEAKKPFTQAEADVLITQAGVLLHPAPQEAGDVEDDDDEESGYAGKFLRALERSPEVARSHEEAVEAFQVLNENLLQ